jgi:N-acetylglucosamine-6-sulfatase
VRTESWKYIRYPHGDHGPDRHKAELYDLRSDPGELRNLIDDPAAAPTLKELQQELERLMARTGLTPSHDPMPLDEGIKAALPAQSIR